jgi:hypothetical protein
VNEKNAEQHNATETYSKADERMSERGDEEDKRGKSRD